MDTFLDLNDGNQSVEKQLRGRTFKTHTPIASNAPYVWSADGAPSTAGRPISALSPPGATHRLNIYSRGEFYVH